MTQPLVSIVVPCRNERHHIEACIRSIFNQTIPSREFEVIVADGRSDDGTRDKLEQLSRQYPQLRVIENSQRIVATGLNVAIRAARGQTILRMDAHTTYAPDCIEQCLEVLRETSVKNVGGPLRTRGERYVERVIAAAFQAPFVVGGARRCDPHYEGFIDTVTYGCWPREVFDRFGWFDEELVRNQDDEYNLRLTRGGGTHLAIAPHCQLVHTTWLSAGALAPAVAIWPLESTRDSKTQAPSFNPAPHAGQLCVNAIVIGLYRLHVAPGGLAFAGTLRHVRACKSRR